MFKVSEQAVDSGREASSQDEEEPGRKRKRFSKGNQCEKDDPMPMQYRNIRSSERKVKPVYYQTCADLTAIGLSIPESIKAINVVSNKMYGRAFKAAEESRMSFIVTLLPLLGI